MHRFLFKKWMESTVTVTCYYFYTLYTSNHFIVGSRVPWTSQEIDEIKKYFKEYISLQSTKTCPGMKEILKVCARSKASGGTIWKRQWELIKKKVSYIVQKAKRK